MSIFQVLRGEWGLTRDAEFRRDPWYIISGNAVLDSGFGSPPKEFFRKTLPPGVVVPGFVNAHSHIELSCLRGKIPPGTSLVGMGRLLQAERGKISSHVIRQAAVAAIREANAEGTFFFCDICNSSDFLLFLRDQPFFRGNRYLELLGFSSPADQKRIEVARALLDRDDTFYPTVHSVYGSSPLQMRFVREKARHTSVSIHLLESPEEIEFQYGRGPIVEFLQELGQYTRHKELHGQSAVEYLHSLGMLSFKKLLLVHLSAARSEDIDLLSEYVPHAAWVLCYRSNRYLGIERSNWESLHHAPLRMLIGTDSLASNSDLSVLRELEALLALDRFSPRELLRAATWDAYEYLEIKDNAIPYFLFPGAAPGLPSLCRVRRAVPLSHFC